MISRADDDRERHVHEELRPARGNHLGSVLARVPGVRRAGGPRRPRGPATPLRCPYCLHAAPLRDFLTLGEPTRPARVEVRVVLPGAGALSPPPQRHPPAPPGGPGRRDNVDMYYLVDLDLAPRGTSR